MSPEETKVLQGLTKELYLLRKQFVKQSPENSLKEVQWALAESYKLAVRLRGINDWTNDFKNPEEKQKAERQVESYQLEIAHLILEARK